jgi:hypothetical protein
MKLTSSSRWPAAAKPGVTGQRARSGGKDSATHRRQNACVRARTAGASASSTCRKVMPEKIVSSTIASDAAVSTPASCSASGTPVGLTTA